jgi:pyrroline-5-carboxylate reductase
MVKSPKGTTEAGLNSLNNDFFDTIIFNAIEKATQRSIELSKELNSE